jgi:hypothetical protein
MTKRLPRDCPILLAVHGSLAEVKMSFIEAEYAFVNEMRRSDYFGPFITYLCLYPFTA